MNRGKSAQNAQRCQSLTQPSKAQQQQQGSQKKKRSLSSSPSPSKNTHCGSSSSRISVTAADAPPAVQSNSKPGGTTKVALECPKEDYCAQRKLSVGSTSDSDSSRDSGCASHCPSLCSSPSPKSSSPDSGSESSDKLQEGESPALRNGEPEETELLSWTDCTRADDDSSPDRSTPGRGGGKGDDTSSSGQAAARTTGPTTREIRVSGGDPLRSSDAAGDSGGGFLGFGGGGFLGDVLGTSSSSGSGGSGSRTYLDPAATHGGPMMMMMMMDDTTEDLVRDMEDLRSENEYLKDEVEELRCELVEMRDMFHQEEAERLQALTLQVEQANRTCRILQYRLRKAERRSIRVAQGGHVDGELVRSLEHDIKVAKCVSVRVHRELEAVQKKASRLEEENEALREKMEEVEVSRMVLQAHMDKTRESSLKRRGVRSPGSKAERRLSQHLEEDSADLKLQLHLAKEELSLVCKKLARLVADSEGTRQELARYRAAYGDVDHACAHAATTAAPPAVSSALAREAEVKVHLRLVEEEATLLSRRIVELEVENRGLRAEMSDLGERGGGGGGGGGEEEEEEEEEEAEGGEPSPPGADDLSPTAQQGETEDGGRGLTTQRGEDGSLRSQSEEDGTSLAVCQIAREGPVGGERDSPENDVVKQQSRGLDYETLLALRGHSCVVSAAIRVLLLTASSQALSPAKEVGGDAAEAPGVLLRGPLKDALELLQSMLLDFAGSAEERVTTAGGTSLQKDGREWDISYVLSPAPGGRGVRGEDDARTEKTSSKAASAEDLRTTEVKQRAQRQCADCAQTSVHGHGAEDLLGLTFQVLWLLHQWWEMKVSGLDGKEVRDKTMPVLRSLLEELGADMINDATPPQSTLTECAVDTFFDEEKLSEADRSYSSKGKRRRRLYAPYGSNLWWKKKNWVYVSQEAAQADVEDRVRTWDHPIMALSFPELDFERVQADRSHTAPETTAARVYYSPPSARRVQLAHLHDKLRSASPVDRTSATDVDSPPSASVSWFTPPSSLSALCLGLSSNLSDDMKEITAGLSPGLRQPVHSASMERRKARGLDVSCSATQTHMMQPQMVSVGLQTDVPQRIGGPPGRAVLSARSTSSLERPGGRVERPRPSSTTSPSTSSPKLFRRHSASSAHSYSTSSPLAGPTSTPTAAAAAPPSRERGSWSNGVTPSWSSASGTANNRAGGGGGGHNNSGSGGGALKSDGGENSTRADGRTNATTTKPPSKAAAGGGRYGMVTEFLRRVSGRAADSKTPGGPMAAQAAAGTSKSGGGFKHLERAVPSRTPPPPGGQGPALQRNDSVTRIVNQRFMKQREDRGQSNGQREDRGQSNGQREDRGQSNGSARGAIPARNHSSASVAAEVRAAEDGSYDIGSSSSRTLSFCFARPSRSAQRQQASQCSKPPQRHRAATSLPGTN